MQFPPMMQPFMMAGRPPMPPMSNLAPPLYVGDLDDNVREEALYDLFSKFGQIYYIRLMKDPNTGRSRGFAYVNFCNPRDAENAKHVAQYEKLGRKHIRIAYKRSNIKQQQNNKSNIFIKNIDKAATIKEVHQEWSKFGTIFSAKLAVDSKGESLGYAYIQFEKEEDAQKALEAAAGGDYKFKETNVTITEFKSKNEREKGEDGNESKKLTNNNIYIKHLPDMDMAELEKQIKEKFGPFGTIDKMAVMKDSRINKPFSFVCFSEAGAAEKAIAHFNSNPGNPFDPTQPNIYVSLSQTRRQRDEELSKNKSQANHQNNLFLKNLKPETTKDSVKEAFATWGTVVSVDVKDNTRAPETAKKTKYGFVAFSNIEDATKARAEAPDNQLVKDLYLEGKPYINIFQPKEERAKFLKTQFRNQHYMQPNPGMQAALMNQNRRVPPMFPYGGFNQMPGRMPMNMGGGNFIPNMNRKPFEQRPPQAGGMISNQVDRPRQGGFRPPQRGPYNNVSGNFGGQRPQGGVPGQGMPKSFGGPQQGARPFPGGNNNFQGGRNQAQAPRDNNGGQQQTLSEMASKPKGEQGLITTGTSGLTIGDLKKKWAEFIALDKDKQRNILGELLFPLIRDQVGEKVAPKITGMLIDLDVLEINDILEFLEDKDLLTERIKEANELIESENA
jgi:polyadenylate-binding protein